MVFTLIFSEFMLLLSFITSSLSYITYIIILLFRANISDILTNEFQVKGLQEGKEYEFRVAARNNAGVGDWAQTSEAIKARAAPGKIITYWFL